MPSPTDTLLRELGEQQLELVLTYLLAVRDGCSRTTLRSVHRLLRLSAADAVFLLPFIRKEI